MMPMFFLTRLLFPRPFFSIKRSIQTQKKETSLQAECQTLGCLRQFWRGRQIEKLLLPYLIFGNYQHVFTFWPRGAICLQPISVGRILKLFLAAPPPLPPALNDGAKILTKTDTETYFRHQIFQNRCFFTTTKFSETETQFSKTKNETFFPRPNSPKLIPKQCKNWQKSRDRD